MYDEAIMAAFFAYCRTRPAWFVDAYIPLVELLHGRGDPAPAQSAWALLLSRAVETGRVDGAGGDGEDCVMPLPG